jgi:lysophospholipase L1-like esterase
MKNRRLVLSRALSLFIAAFLVAGGLTRLHGQSPAKRRIAVFGSSVANGTGDELGKEGYTGRLRDMMAPRGWEVVNQSRGGDTTLTMAPRFAPVGAPQPNTKYLLPANPNYVLLGLSLGNEGIAKPEKDAIYTQFETGMHGFIDRSRENHIIPIVTNCYTRNTFTDVEYGYTRRMNLLINTWDVPSVNFLGAVDDGTGKWATGFWWDALHPNASGHDELTTTFVPTLFDAIEQGKPLPKKSTAAGFATVTNGVMPIEFEPADKMHPFALAFDVRGESTVDVAAISGVALTATTATKQVAAGRGGAMRDLEETTLTPSGQQVTARVSSVGGVWTYTTANGHERLRSTVRADADWHHIVVSHYTARGETLFFVDGQLAGRAEERFEPKRFVVGGPGASDMPTPTRRLDVKDLMIYRSALNADEVSAMAKGVLLQSSLEVYAPLADATFKPGQALQNLAQATTFAKVGDGVITHVEK